MKKWDSYWQFRIFPEDEIIYDEIYHFVFLDARIFISLLVNGVYKNSSLKKFWLSKESVLLISFSVLSSNALYIK